MAGTNTPFAAHSHRREEPRQLFSVQNVALSPPLAADKAPAKLQVSFTIEDRSRRLHLLLDRNDDIFSHHITVNRVRKDGAVYSAETIPAGSHLAYRGTAVVSQEEQDQYQDHDGSRGVGWARVAVQLKDGVELVEGAFSIDGVDYHMQTDSTYRRSWRTGDPEAPKSDAPYMVVWKYTEEEDGGLAKRQESIPGTCGAEDLDSNLAWMHGGSHEASLESRQNQFGTTQSLLNSLGSTDGCPGTRAIALVGIATDCTYTQLFSSNDDLRHNVITQINSASRVYEDTFNVSLRPSNITISDAECPTNPDSTSTPWNRQCSRSEGLGSRLNDFSTWKAGFDDGTAVWTLLTTCNSGSTVGIAWLGTVCRPGSLVRGSMRSNPSTNVVARTESEWQVIAHEIGHNFGASHDCTSSCSGESSLDCCPFNRDSCSANSRFIMSPAVNTRISEFSPCSIGQICSAMGRNVVRTACLSGNEDVPTISDQLCGNGVVDEGEDCDCGGEEGCGDNACCDPSTCRFTSGSTCDPSTQRCCTNQCQPAGSGQVCRASVGLCDPEESCDGSSADCPEDETLPDGQSCGEDGQGTTCASGRCTSRSMQCSSLLTSSNTTSLTSSNITSNVSAQACSEDGCQLNCINLDEDDNTCQVTQQFFLDGTPCGRSGRCYSGNCNSTNGNNRVQDWIDENRSAFIAICVVGGIVVLALLASLCCCVSRRSQRKKQQREMATWISQNQQRQGQRRMPPLPPGYQGQQVFRPQSMQQRPQQPMQGPMASPPPLVPRQSNLQRYA